MTGKQVFTPITERIADGDITPIEATRLAAAVKLMMDQLKVSDAALRAYLGDSVRPKEHLTTNLGVATYMRGREAKPRVKDMIAFGGWLADVGEEGLTDSGYVLPTETATKPDVIKSLLEKHGVKEIPGVEFSRGTNDTVSVKPTVDWDGLVAEAEKSGIDMTRLLVGGTSETKEDKKNEVKESELWAAN